MKEQKMIQQYHEELLAFLLVKSAENETFRFRVRLRGEEQLSNGYWFAGDEDYLATSFWTGSDDTTGLPSISVMYSFVKKVWSINFICSDDTEAYIRQMVLGKMSGFKEYTGSFSLELISSSAHWLDALNDFISKQKEWFDFVLSETPFEQTKKTPKITKSENGFDDLTDISKKWQIPASKFKKNVQNIRLWQSSFNEYKRITRLNGKITKNEFGLTRIEIMDFHGIKHLKLENIPTDAKWIFLTGENGFGKTSVLRAIAKGIEGDETPYMPAETRIFANVFYQKKALRFIPKSRQTIDPGFPVVGYGVSRFQTLSLDSEKSEKINRQSTYSLFKDDGRLRNIERLLLDAERDNQQLFLELKDIFKKIIPALHDIKSQLRPKTKVGRDLYYYEKDETGKQYVPVLLHDWATGYRSVLTMIGDMIMHLWNGQSKISDIGGIALIDEIDAHLHPKYQYELPQLLSEVFPKVQFIVTTHSPIPILGLAPDNRPVVFTVERTAPNGITIERKDDDFDIRKLNPESLLTSPIFGFQTLFARGAHPSEIIPSGNFKEAVESEDLRQRLKKLRAEGAL